MERSSVPCISCPHCGPVGGRDARVGMHGSIMPGRFLVGEGRNYGANQFERMQ
jgi:hypothetical protein